MKSSSAHIWKCTWYWNDKDNSLKVANNSKSLAQDVVGEQSEKVKSIFDTYLSDKR